jgi:hypothetical protein
MVACLATRVAYFAIYCFSPLRPEACDGLILASRLAFVLMLAEITLRQFIKYLYIFSWKCVVGLDDDFFAKVRIKKRAITCDVTTSV